jgi:LemA protein
VGADSAAAGSAAASGGSAAAARVAAAAARVGERRIWGMNMRRQALLLVALTVMALPLTGCSYNRFVSQEEAIKAQWAQVQNQLQRRNDLIPNLVETVKGYASQERDIFTAVAESRSRMMNAKTPDDQIEAANAQTSALARLLAVVENYPQLKSDANFQRLMDELAGTENRIAVARQRYNDTARQYNTLRRQFPSNVTGKVFGFQEYKYFEVPPESQKLPKVDFSR